MKKYIDSLVNIDAIKTCMKNLIDINSVPHTLSVHTADGKKLLEISPEPYSADDVTEVYSLSKTFMSTVAGIAWDLGLFSLDDRIVDIFPDKVPEHISDNLGKMTVKNILSMNSGHESCRMGFMKHSDDVVKEFLRHDPPYEPGTHFAYNTGATCVAAAVIERITGRDFFDFASEYLFLPLGITDVYWSKCEDGTCEGGVGLHISARSIAKLGIMYLNNGVYNGRRILSKEWIDIATSSISDNSGNGDQNWCSGYGLQIWRNCTGGYRGDGAFGQNCVVLPESGVVVTMTTLSLCTDVELKHLIELGENILAKGGSGGEIEDFDFAPTGGEPVPSELLGTYRLCDNLCGFTFLNIAQEDGRLELAFFDGEEMQKISAGNGEWVYSEYWAANRTPKLGDIMSANKYELLAIMSSYRFHDGKIIVESRYISNPHNETVTLAFDGGSLRIGIDENSDNRQLLATDRFFGKRI